MKNPITNLFRYTWKYSGDQKWRVALFMTLSIIANIVILANPYVISRIFNTVQFSPGDPQLLRFVMVNIGFLLVIEVVFWLFHGTSRVIERRFHFVIRKNYKEDMMNKVLDLPVSWHKDHHSGDTIDKINTAAQSLYMFSGRIFFIIQVIVGLVGTMAILLFFDWRASIIVFVTAIVAVGSVLLVDRVLQKRYKILYKFENLFATAIHDYVTNIITIITLKLKPRVMSEVDRRGLAGYPTHHQVEFWDELKWFWVSFLIALMTATALWVNASHSFNTTGVIMIGTLFALFGYLKNVGNSFFQIAYRYGEMVRENAALEHAERIVQEYDTLKVKEQVYLPQNWQRLCIQGLYFSYEEIARDENSSEQAKKVMHHLHDVSLDLHRGERVAFIGESGSGKSTSLAVLRGLYEPEKGELVVDGHKMEHGLRHLASHITLVPQDPEIFNSTVEDNVTMEISVADEELARALRLARFDDVVTRLPKGLATNILEKGVSLSGGEKQRLALARGILAARDSDILFLDEPTSSVDATNEMAIYQSIFKELPDTTIVSTIHRLHLLLQFDRIYQFENGKVIASGTLKEMMKTPKFKTLWDDYHKNQESV
ncbi:MAG: ABC transporter ATP-binding protein [Candidatus Pacebacteria bacterium]|nr:ABC transporter ATP-binding protein [Candidatus Paceibacterota bacterium]